MKRIDDVVGYFWAHVDRRGADECWPWIGATFDSGYGDLHGVARRQGMPRRAHRFSYVLHHGPIPDGQLACHHCDTPACVNPAHLFLGTDSVNIADRDAKGRTRAGYRPWANLARGERKGNSSLTEVDVRRIRELHASGHHPKALASMFGVRSRTTIVLIVKRETWRHVA